MAVLRDHIPYYLDILCMDEFLRDPVLVFGSQDCYCEKKRTLKKFIKQRAKLWFQLLLKRKFEGVKHRRLRKIPLEFQVNNLQEILKNYGMNEVKTLDFFDDRADFNFDMNNPLLSDLKGRFKTVIDIGSIEHVFDTKQCLWNLFDLLQTEGHLLIHTPCNGYFDHGFHTFSPEYLAQSVELNGFKIKYLKFSTPDGIELKNPNSVCDALIWIVARKVKNIKHFNIPQQGRWEKSYHIF